MTYDYDLIVIGAGGGGLTAAIGGAGIGASVLLIEGEKLGGDCTHYGCVPSKALIHAAKIAHSCKQRESVGLSPIENANDDAHAVLSHVRGVVDDIESRFEDPVEIQRSGVEIEMGFAHFLDAHTVEVNGRKISGKKFVIATGARPTELPIEGLSDVSPKTNRTIFESDDFQSLTIIGSGPIGVELGQAFARLGINVNIITRDDRVLSRETTAASEIVGASLEDDGVSVHLLKDVSRVFIRGQKKVVSVKCKETDQEQEIEADEILVAIGRQPNVEKLGLDNAGVVYDARKGVQVDERTRTSVPHIHAVGDVATKWKFTHYANHMAKVALENMIFHLPAKVSDVIPRSTFTSPEVASIGVIAEEVLSRSDHCVFEKKYDHVDRAITDVAENGFFQIVTDKKGMIKGASIVGGPAGEMINEIALAMAQGISISKLADTIHAYPTYGYGLRNCADQFRSLGYTKSKKRLVKRIFGLRGNSSS